MQIDRWRRKLHEALHRENALETAHQQLRQRTLLLERSNQQLQQRASMLEESIREFRDQRDKVVTECDQINTLIAAMCTGAAEQLQSAKEEHVKLCNGVLAFVDEASKQFVDLVIAVLRGARRREHNVHSVSSIGFVQ